MLDSLTELFKTDGFITLFGVTLGILLGFGVRWLESIWHDRKAVSSIREELGAIKLQIPQTRNILQQMVDGLVNQQVLPGRSVKFMRLAYTQLMPLVQTNLTCIQRNCLHNIHERALNVEYVMDNFEHSVPNAIKLGYMNDPIAFYRGLLGNMIESLQVMEKLIDSYVSGKPIDPLYTKEGGFDVVRAR